MNINYKEDAEKAMQMAIGKTIRKIEISHNEMLGETIEILLTGGKSLRALLIGIDPHDHELYIC